LAVTQSAVIACGTRAEKRRQPSLLRTLPRTELRDKKGLLPTIGETLDTLAGARWFSRLDLKSGYWQVALRPEDKGKTAFSTGQKLWQFTVMPFDIVSPSKIQATNGVRPERSDLRYLPSILG